MGAPYASATEVLLLWPQFIGYLRAALYVLGFVIIDVPSLAFFAGWQLCVVCYTLAFVLDVVDGHVARAMDQCSQLGGVLDMVLDRAATAALLTTLAGAYPVYRLCFAFLVALDVGSHWMHVASCQLMPSKQHHKGLGAHIERYRNSPVMHESVPDEYKPAMYTRGVRVPFPPPTKNLRMPRIRKLGPRCDDGGPDDLDDMAEPPPGAPWYPR
jgi:phosphatidylglycerophosphate synthase